VFSTIDLITDIYLFLYIFKSDEVILSCIFITIGQFYKLVVIKRLRRGFKLTKIDKLVLVSLEDFVIIFFSSSYLSERLNVVILLFDLYWMAIHVFNCSYASIKLKTLKLILRLYNLLGTIFSIFTLMTVDLNTALVYVHYITLVGHVILFLSSFKKVNLLMVYKILILMSIFFTLLGNISMYLGGINEMQSLISVWVTLLFSYVVSTFQRKGFNEKRNSRSIRSISSLPQ